MSQENVEIVRRWNAAYNRRDFETMFELTDPDLEFTSIFSATDRCFADMTGCVPTSMESTPPTLASKYHPRDSSTLGRPFLQCHIEWRGNESGAEGTMPMAVAAWLKAGRVFHLESYPNLNDGLKAVGLSEQDAHANS